MCVSGQCASGDSGLFAAQSCQGHPPLMPPVSPGVSGVLSLAQPLVQASWGQCDVWPAAHASLTALPPGGPSWPVGGVCRV